MGIAKPSRDEPVDRLPYCLIGRTAEHLLGRSIEKDDTLIAIDADDCIHGRTDNAGQAYDDRFVHMRTEIASMAEPTMLADRT
jgi:hypothetical protein